MYHDSSTFYLQLEPQRSEYRINGEYQLRGFKAVRVNQKEPKDPLPGTVTVKLTMRVPETMFQLVMPAAIVEIPEGFGVSHPIQVIVEEPE